MVLVVVAGGLWRRSSRPASAAGCASRRRRLPARRSAIATTSSRLSEPVLDQRRRADRRRRADPDPVRRRHADRLAAVAAADRADHTAGILGTFLTAALGAVAVQIILPCRGGQLRSRRALAPTDPAVMFSVLARRDIAERISVILQGESGANDPVGIALVLALLVERRPAPQASARRSRRHARPGDRRRRRCRRGDAARAGDAANAGRRLPLPVRSLAGAGIIYGVATVLTGRASWRCSSPGSGRRARSRKGEIELFHQVLANLGEIVVFVALGLTIHLDSAGRPSGGRPRLAVMLVLIVRPAGGAAAAPDAAADAAAARRRSSPGRVQGRRADPAGGVHADRGRARRPPDLRPRLRRRGCVRDRAGARASRWPAALRRADDGAAAAARVGASHPSAHEPEGVVRLVVGPAAIAAGRRIRELPIGEGAWVALVVRGGRTEQPRGSFRLEPGDEVVLLTEPGDEAALRRVFTRPRSEVPRTREAGVPAARARWAVCRRLRRARTRWPSPASSAPCTRSTRTRQGRRRSDRRRRRWSTSTTQPLAVAANAIVLRAAREDDQYLFDAWA